MRYINKRNIQIALAFALGIGAFIDVEFGLLQQSGLSDTSIARIRLIGLAIALLLESILSVNRKNDDEPKNYRDIGPGSIGAPKPPGA